MVMLSRRFSAAKCHCIKVNPDELKQVLLVCTHGFLASVESFAQVREKVEKQVEASDRIGFGRTSRPTLTVSWYMG